MRRMTVTEGLVELKLLDSRIRKAIGEPVWMMVVYNKDLNSPSVETFKKDALANYESVLALINNRNAIKSAIVKSNATTTLRIGGMEMTVAEAIERKTSIEYEKELLKTFRNVYAVSERSVQSTNQQVQAKIDNMLNQLAASSKENVADAQKAMAENYMASNGAALVDPLDIKAKIAELDARIDMFLSNIDTALSVTNATTFIEI